MTGKKMDEAAAFKWMQQESRNKNIKIVKLAEIIIEYSKKTQEK